MHARSADTIQKRPSFLKITSILLAVTTLIALTLCAFLVGKYFFADAFADSHLLTVPDLRGKIFSEQMLPDAELFQIVRAERFSDAPVGTVLSQDPAPGSERKAVRGKHYVTLTVYISKGVETATVPSVIGLTEGSGTAALLKAGFSPVIEECFDAQPAGEILSQSIPAGSAEKVGETVTLTVSRGLRIRKVEVPSLTGLSLVQAKSRLEAYGLKVGSIRHRTSEGKENCVLSQSVLPMLSLPEGARIDLTVSKKPEETAPITETQPESVPEASEPPEPHPEDPEDLIDRILEKIFPESNREHSRKDPHE